MTRANKSKYDLNQNAPGGTQSYQHVGATCNTIIDGLLHYLHRGNYM